MLEKPDIQDAVIVDGLRNAYDLDITQVIFLPLGADVNTAVFRVITEAGVPYFLKLRRGLFDETAAVVPKLLHDQGVTQVIAPRMTRAGALWMNLAGFTALVSPFVEGRDGYEVALSPDQWAEFGRAVKGIHTAVLSPDMLRRIPPETYSPHWREQVRQFQRLIETGSFADPLAAELAAFLRNQQDVVSGLVRWAERLAAVLQSRTLPVILCHTDLHAGNLLITAAGAVCVVDWDNPILAPKERDLMFIGGGLLGDWYSPDEEIALFYRGYGHAPVDPVALAYYRSERIVQDIAAFCQEILSPDHSQEDRERGLRFLKSNFLPDATIDITRRSGAALPPELRFG